MARHLKPHERNEWAPWIRAALVGFALALALAALVSLPAHAAPDDEVRSTFDQFVAAQNAHDPAAVRALLLDSPNFLWITRGNVIWGRDAAIKRFEANYAGTWKLTPKMAELKVMVLSDSAAQLYVPILFTIGAAGQPAQESWTFINQTLVKTADGWKVLSILPISAPNQ
jgi:ketosteroid isomerase-like protein